MTDKTRVNIGDIVRTNNSEDDNALYLGGVAAGVELAAAAEYRGVEAEGGGMKFGSVCSGIEAASVAEKTCTKCGAKKPLTDYIKSYLPCAVILSNQIDGDILLRYRAEKWAVITGVVGLNNPLASTYDFMRDVVGYDLAGFFQRNTETLRTEVDAVLRALLAPDGH